MKGYGRGVKLEKGNRAEREKLSTCYKDRCMEV